jgi:hypothetical protein
VIQNGTGKMKMNALKLLCVVVMMTALVLGGCVVPPPPTPTPTPSPTPPPALPVQIASFQSTSGRTIIQYYTYTSPPCGTGVGCDFRGIVATPPGFDQVEVFLSGFDIETLNQEDKINRIKAEVHKFRYDPTTGDLEVGVTGNLSTGTPQPYSYEVTFVVLLTDAAAARFTQVGNGCTGVADCHVIKTLPGAVPPGMHYIGLGTRIFDLGSDSGPLPINALSMHIDGLTITPPPDVQVDYACVLRDAAAANKMFCEWDASIIAFDPAEMDRNDSNIFPQYTMLARNVSSAKTFFGQARPFSGGTIAGFLDALEGVSLFYGQGQEHTIWRVDSSASGFQMNGVPPNVAITEYAMFLGVTFGDVVNTQPYSFQLSRAVGLLR